MCTPSPEVPLAFQEAVFLCGVSVISLHRASPQRIDINPLMTERAYHHVVFFFSVTPVAFKDGTLPADCMIFSSLPMGSCLHPQGLLAR